MRKLVTLSGVAIAAAVVVSGMLTGTGRATLSTISADKPGHEERWCAMGLAATQSQTAQDPPGTIDGSVTPQLIPDVVAYELFFNFFSNRASTERGKLQAYCNQTALAGVDLDSIFALVNYYQQRVAPINAKAQAIRNSNPGLTMQDAMLVNAQLAPFAAEKAAVVQEVIAKIPTFVGATGAVAIRQHIDGRMKPHIKIVPGPSMSQTQTQTP